MKQNDEAGEPRLLARRELLQFGAAGLVAMGAAMRHPRRQERRRQDRARAQRPPQPPAPEAIANPATMRVEDWSEPWVWRPEEWPGQPLALQIVGNRHVPRAVSPGNRFTPLFSFNGASPGPTIRTRGDAVLRVKLRNMLGPNHGRVPKGPTPDPFEIPPADLNAALCAISKAQGDGLLRAADAGARASRRDPSSHSGHARGHELPGQPRERAARLAHHEPAHARRARAAGNESERHGRGQHLPPRAAQGRLGDPPARRPKDAGAPSTRTSGSGRPTSNSRSATSWGPSRAGAVRASPTLQARTGITRTVMAPHTIRSPAVSPASSSSKAMSTMRSTGDDRERRGRIQPRRPGPSTTASAS